MIRVLADSTTGVIGAPHIEYGQLAPMLVVFSAAVVGVLVEAFVPRPVRRAVQLVLALGSLLAAFILTIVVASNNTIFADGSPGHVAAMGAVGVDRPTLFIQGTIVVLAFVSLLLIGDTSNSPFAAQAAATPGSPEEREGLAAGIMHTEIFPLTMFAVGGMMLFPASNDLLTMFVALEVLSLPLYLLCGLARRRRLLSHEAAMKYFLLGAFSSAFFLFGIAMLYGFSGSVSLSAHRVRGVQQHRQPDAAVRRDRAGRHRAAVQDRRGALPGLEAGRLPGRAHADHRADGVLRGGVGLRRAAARLLRGVRHRELVLAARALGGRRPHHGGRRRHRHHPDRRQAAPRLLLDRARRVRPDRGHRDQRRRACRAACSTWPPTVSPRWARSR